MKECRTHARVQVWAAAAEPEVLGVGGVWAAVQCKDSRVLQVGCEV